MWYKLAQIDPKNIQPLDPTKFNQQIPQNGALEIQMEGTAGFNMGPQDPPKLIQVKSKDGSVKNIIILHGTPDDMLTFPDDSGKLQAGTVEEFDKWRASKGWQNYPWISCFGGKIAGSSSQESLLNNTGAVYVGTHKDEQGDTIMDFSDTAS